MRYLKLYENYDSIEDEISDYFLYMQDDGLNVSIEFNNKDTFGFSIKRKNGGYFNILEIIPDIEAVISRLENFSIILDNISYIDINGKLMVNNLSSFDDFLNSYKNKEGSLGKLSFIVIGFYKN